MRETRWLSALVLAVLMLSCSPVVKKAKVDLRNEFSRAAELFQEGLYQEAMPGFLKVARGLEAAGDQEKARFAYRNVVTCYEKGGFSAGSPQADMAAEAELKLVEPDER